MLKRKDATWSYCGESDWTVPGWWLLCLAQICTNIADKWK